MKNYKKTALMVLGLSACLLGSTASAGSLTGTYVTYVFDDAKLGLFGTPSLDGEDLVFTANGFEAQALDNGDMTTDRTLYVDVIANTGYQLSSFGLTEGGSYQLQGSNDLVDVDGVFAVRDNNNPNSKSYATTFGPLSALDNHTNIPTNWNAATNVLLSDTGWSGMVGNTTLTISNLLYAEADLIGAASITKDFVRISAVTTPVPEAETYAMMLAGLGLIGFMARRTRIAV
jgi:hypothetical protein